MRDEAVAEPTRKAAEALGKKGDLNAPTSDGRKLTGSQSPAPKVASKIR
jgi:hypothetical protein